MSTPGGLAGEEVRQGRVEERGSGTALALALIIILAAAGYVLATLTAGFAALQRAESAADLAALAAAQVLNDPLAEGDPCQVAREIAQVPMTGCEVTGAMVTIETTDTVVFGAFAGREMVGRARAGPR
ncbi:MAG: hypothetical protein Q4P33_08450 [Flaviflexus sp.]|nr:hypothetical protein [Flaviflexus sp.]